mgnify:CR=1 FL=1
MPYLSLVRSTIGTHRSVPHSSALDEPLVQVRWGRGHRGGLSEASCLDSYYSTWLAHVVRANVVLAKSTGELEI